MEIFSNYTYLPQRGSNAYQMSGLNEIERKVASVKVHANATYFLDDKGNVLIFALKDDMNKRTNLQIRNNNNKETYLSDFDQDGKYDNIFSIQKLGKVNVRLNFKSTKDDDNYDENYYNINDEKSQDGLLIYRPMPRHRVS